MTTCPSCGIAGNNFSCPNHISFWGINPLPDSIPFPQHGGITLTPPVNTELFAEIGRLSVLLNERNKEIERLKGLMPPDERGPGFVGQGSWSVFAEKVVAERDALREVLTGLREKGIIDQHNRPLPLEGHHKDCGHGKDGWSLCTCDELKKVDEVQPSKQPKCSKCGDTGLVQVAPNARGVKQCDCKKYGSHHPECGRAKPGMRSPCNCLGLYERDARNQRDLDRCFDELVEKKTCEHGNTECKRCEVGQPTRDHHQDLKIGDIVRFEVEGVITARQTGGIIKDYDGNDYEPVQYVVRETLSGNKCSVPYYQILAVIGEEE